ncbi:MAG TPA: hypothetical protein VJ824_05515, partial [Bacillota bacterium]|nr:hypothetical protein [Bacillota bacterium]
MSKIFLTLSILIGVILPTQAFAESDGYISYLSTGNESYSVDVDFNQNGSTDIQYSYANALCRIYEHGSVNVSYEENGTGTFNFDDITGTIDPSTHSLTI